MTQRAPLNGDVVPGKRKQDGLQITTHLHPDPGAGPWRLSLSWRTFDGRPECVAVHLDHLAPHPGMHSPGEVLLRSLNIATRVAEERVRLMREAGTVEARRPRGMRKETFERLGRVAAVYRAAVADGRPPIPAVAEHLGVAHGTASATVARARKVGLLPPTNAGVPMG